MLAFNKILSASIIGFLLSSIVLSIPLLSLFKIIDQKIEIAFAEGPKLDVRKELIGSAVPGQLVTFKITGSNVGNSPVQHTVIVDKFPQELTFVSGKLVPQNTPCTLELPHTIHQHVLCHVGTLNAGAEQVAELQFTVSESAQCGSRLTNEADINAQGGLTDWSKIFVPVSCDTPPPPPSEQCIDRISIQADYSLLKAKNDVYFHLTVHKTGMNDWKLASDNRPWGSTPITDIDLTQTPTGTRNPKIPVGFVSAGNQIYQHNNLNQLGGNDWHSINRNQPWGSGLITNVGVSGRKGNTTLRGILSVGSTPYFFSTWSKNNPYGVNVWADVSDNKPWGNAPIDDIDVDLKDRGFVLAGGIIYHHPDLKKLDKKDWVITPAKEHGLSDVLKNATRIDLERSDAIASRGTDVYHTSTLKKKGRWRNKSDNKPWGNTTVEDVTLYMWTSNVEPWQTRAIAMLVADNKPFFHWNPTRSNKSGPRKDWVDASDNAPWNLPGGACNRVIRPELSIHKNGPSSRERGQTAFYTITAFNGGLSPQHNLTITDTVPSGLIYNDSASTPSCSLQGNTVVCPLGTLYAQQSSTVTIAFDVPTVISCSPGTITNTAVLQPTNQTSSVQTTLTCPATPNTSLTIEKWGPESTEPGGTVSYTLTVKNDGQTNVNDVVVLDIFDDEFLTFLPGQSTAGCVQAIEGGEKVIRCEVGTLTPGQTQSFTLKFQVSHSAECETFIENLADVHGRNGINDWDSTAAEVLCEESSSSSSSISSTAGPASLNINQSCPSSVVHNGVVLCQITTQNTGGNPANGVVIASHKIGGLTFVPGQSTFGCVDHGNHIACSVGNLGGGSSKNVTVAFSATENCGGVVKSKAVAQGAGGLSSPIDEDNVNVICGGSSSSSSSEHSSSSAISSSSSIQSSYSSSAVSSDSSVSSVSSASAGLNVDIDGPVNAAKGGTVTYTVDASNNGSPAPDAVVNVHGIDGLTLVSAPGCTDNGNHIHCPIPGGPLHAGNSPKTFTLKFTLDNALACSAPKTVQAVLAAAGGVFTVDETSTFVTCP